MPLIISALENYEYTFQPIVIFSRRYQKEVKIFQDKVSVQKADFANECSILLDSVSDHGSDMINNLQHWSWQDQEIGPKLKARLEGNYEACVSALRIINGILIDILKETGAFDILVEQVRR